MEDCSATTGGARSKSPSAPSPTETMPVIQAGEGTYDNGGLLIGVSALFTDARRRARVVQLHRVERWGHYIDKIRTVHCRLAQVVPPGFASPPTRPAPRTSRDQQARGSPAAWTLPRFRTRSPSN